MSRISPEFLQKLKEAVNLVDVVSEHVVLKKTGNNYTGLCPFHNERSPSFSVSEQKQLFHCYGCKEGGDLIGFTMKLHGLSFPEAIEELAQRGKVPLPKDFRGATDDPERAKQRDEKNEKVQTAFKLNRFVASFYHSQLRTERHIHEYLKLRGIHQADLMRSFYLGAAPGGWDALTRHLIDKKAPLPVATELGLIRPSQKGPKTADGPGFFDLFRNRAMFPILDTRGRVVAFGGRQVPPAEGAPDTGSDGPKYLNSSESFLFQKSKVLFGLFQAGKHIRETGEVLIVEGYFDVLALHAAGFQNAVATCGTALTKDHLQMLRRFCDRIILLFDGDRAGREATDRAMEVGMEEGMVLHAAELPDDLDPDEILFESGTGKVLDRGVLKMREILTLAEPLLDRRIAQAVAEAQQGPEARTQVIKRVAGWLAKFHDPVGREVRLSEFVRVLGIDRNLLAQAAGGASGGVGQKFQNPAQNQGRNQPDFGSPMTQQGPRMGSQGPGTGGFSRAQRAPMTIPTGNRTVRARRPTPLSPAERVGIQLMAYPVRARAWMASISPQIPTSASLADLFDYTPARDFMALLLAPNGADADSLSLLQSEPTRFLDSATDPELRATLAPVLMQEAAEPSEEEVHMATQRLLAKIWARFSHGLREQLAAAEAQKNMGLHADLMKEYLDVQRRMQEFSSFYDEA